MISERRRLYEDLYSKRLAGDMRLVYCPAGKTFFDDYVMPMPDGRMLVSFMNGESRICRLSRLYGKPEFKHFLRCGTRSGATVMYEGYGISFGHGEAEVLCDELYTPA